MEQVPTPSSPALSDEAYAILISAVNLARGYQIRSVAVLRAELERHYPGRQSDIDAAITYWANNSALRRTGYSETW